MYFWYWIWLPLDLPIQFLEVYNKSYWTVLFCIMNDSTAHLILFTFHRTPTLPSHSSSIFSEHSCTLGSEYSHAWYGVTPSLSSILHGCPFHFPRILSNNISYLFSSFSNLSFSEGFKYMISTTNSSRLAASYLASRIFLIWSILLVKLLGSYIWKDSSLVLSLFFTGTSALSQMQTFHEKSIFIPKYLIKSQLIIIS